MKRIEFNLRGLAPPDVRVNAALGSFGAVPPYIVPPGAEIITSVEDAEAITGDSVRRGVIHSLMPLKVKGLHDREWFTLPTEPLVSVSGKNVIVRRTVAKGEGHGTVKECWSRDDYTVTIRGVVCSTGEDRYPADEVRRLADLLAERRSVEVAHDILLLLGIKFLAIESASFPHTKGLNNQNFEIKAYSDTNAELLISL